MTCPIPSILSPPPQINLRNNNQLTMATGEGEKGEGEAGEGGREGGGEGVQAMERDNALSHDRIVPLPPLTLEVTINKRW